ncbi:hypothetical protein KW850_05320 [Bacillus sp. sid0103]|uniref:hypothetical protein n=1 Tax=Bacillus sp. sid0103 TaxID=2856337 RepID=UPI001C491E79|nr:hypothetical protein [Bacillus sp. sid0103]MBV7504684.1 hypothetical protein [Bacillus sp. sid0103]
MIGHLIYDRHFDLNEWFVLGMIIAGIGLIYFLPKILPGPTVAFCLLIGPYLGMTFDHTISVPPLDLYDVGDGPSFSFFDLLSYTMYAPFGYIFIYFYERLNINGQKKVIYIIIWTIMAILLEKVCNKVGIFHYKNGYKLYKLAYSIPIYFFVESLLLFFYLKFFRKKTFPKESN